MCYVLSFCLGRVKSEKVKQSLHPQDQNLVRSKEEVDTFWSWVKMLWSQRSHSIKEEW
jgi:hypothetical protein